MTTEANIGNAKQRRIFNTLSGLEAIPKVTVTRDEGNSSNEIFIRNTQVYVPDFRLVWCNGKHHYRVYIYIADTKNDKKNAGYCICTIGNVLSASGFNVLYAFINKHRANNKSDAE